jgi:hypothetical protein
MSDESLMPAPFSNESCDECAPTERDPRRAARALPGVGVALSVLWWLEGDATAAADEQSAS